MKDRLFTPTSDRSIMREIESPGMRHETALVVPIRKYGLLDLSIYRVFCGRRFLSFTQPAYSGGINCVGKLIQMPEADVFKRFPVSGDLEHAIKLRLAEHNLEFGMTAPGWDAPERASYWSVGPRLH